MAELPLPWLHLETDSRVTSYCERPPRIADARPSRAVDFWVCEDGHEVMVIVLRPVEVATIAQGMRPFPAFEVWTRSRLMELWTLHLGELDDPELLRRNQLTMLRYLAASAFDYCNAFAPDILRACRGGLTLGDNEERPAPLDPMVSRAVAFKLILSGALHCRRCHAVAGTAHCAGDTVRSIAFGALRFDRRSIPAELSDIPRSPYADESALSEPARSRLARRIHAMTLFVDGRTPLREITRLIA